MPGFLKEKEDSSSLIFANNGSELYTNNFYGFVYEPSNGSLTVKQINNKSDLIELPESSEPDYNDEYLYWIWSGPELDFTWNTSYGNRLIMEVK